MKRGVRPGDSGEQATRYQPAMSQVPDTATQSTASEIATDVIRCG
jgi:hypothetical protein